jgi:hypothetical protein
MKTAGLPEGLILEINSKPYVEKLTGQHRRGKQEKTG